MNEQLFKEPKATQLEKERKSARREGRITYDCFQAIFHNEAIECRCRIPLGKRYSVELEPVLSGYSGPNCPACDKYDEGPTFDSLGILVRYAQALRRHNIFDIDLLVGKTEKEILALRWLGPSAIENIKGALAKNGMSLKEN